MELKRAQDGSRVTLAVLGDLDMYTAPDLLDAGTHALEQDEIDTLVVDLGGLDFTDSTGLRTFVGLHTQAGEHDAQLVLRNLPEPTTRLLQLTGLDTVLNIG